MTYSTTHPMNSQQIIDEIFDLYAAHGHRQYGEEVTELQHALQCAHLAHRAGESPALVAACLLHDYGHLVHDLGEDIADQGVDAQHETLGADALAVHFPATVVEPIRLHVEAKRYLCWRQPRYLSSLSAASQRSLTLQGGLPDLAETIVFSQKTHSAEAVRLRRYDDAAKRKDYVVPELTSYRALLLNVLNQSGE